MSRFIKKLAPYDSIIYSDEWKAYDGLVNAGYKKHYRVTHSEDVFANGRAHVNGIENFWGVAKGRISKMRGIKKEKFNLHLKETEWCFNHRNDDIYKLLGTRLSSFFYICQEERINKFTEIAIPMIKSTLTLL